MSLQNRIKHYWRLWIETTHLMVGLPDYQRYVARQRRHNANAPVMSEKQVIDYCQKRRLGGKGSRGCC